MLRAIGTGGRGDSQAPPTINLGYTEGVEATWLHSERTEMDRLLVRAAELDCVREQEFATGAAETVRLIHAFRQPVIDQLES